MKIKKRLLASVLSLLLSICCVGLVACGGRKCEHNWGEWSITANSTCEEASQERTCSKCGETETSTTTPLEHTDANFDHECDYECGETLGTCEDANNDHECDYGCEKVFGECTDSETDGDHTCDYGCGAIVEQCSDVDGDDDHDCDICGGVDITSHDYSQATCGMPATCAECEATTGSTLEHKDENHDHICDNNCGKNDMG